MRQTVERPRIGTVRSNPRKAAGKLWGVLAVGLVLAACSSSQESSDPPTTTSPTPSSVTSTATPSTTTSTTIAPAAIARTFVESVGSSIDRAIEVVAPGAAVEVAGADSYEDLEGWLEWNIALGWSQTDVNCSGQGASIVCAYTYSTPWMEQTDVAPHRGSTYTLQIEDGMITSIGEDLDLDPFWPLWKDFTRWIAIEHADAGILEGDEPILTEEALARWHELSAEFTERLVLLKAGNAYVDALLSLDPSRLELVAGGDPDVHEDLYLQGWTTALNYRLAERSCDVARGRLACTMAGTDDLGDVLGVTYSDRFDISLSGERIVRIIWSTSADPQAIFDDFQDWLRAQQPELFSQSGACANFFQRGATTPEECALAWLDAAPAFVEMTS